MTDEILGYRIYDGTHVELMKEVLSRKEKIHIISGNPEVLTSGLKDEVLFNNFTSSNSIIIPDGIGVVISAKLAKSPVAEKIAGIEVFAKLLEAAEREKRPIYLLGSKEETLTLTRTKLKEKYPSLIIAGSHNGYFDLDNCNDIIEDIVNSKAEMLFAAMGAPRQEKFIVKYMETLPCKIFMGVGGTFDVISGKVNRAPRWMINLGMEWLYRVSKEPFRIKRLGVIPKFIYKAMKEKQLKGEKN